MRNLGLFVSHSWRYADQYQRLVRLLRARSYFTFRDYSVPLDDPVHVAGSDFELRQAILSHMRPCHVVLILAGVYATYSRWINIEIELAREGFAQAKPIIAVKPRGSARISNPVRRAADDIVAWNTESIVRAIRRLA